MTEMLTLYFQDTLPLNCLEIDGELWFVGSDVAEALEHRDANTALRALDDDKRKKITVRTLGGEQEKLFVSESGLYSLILKSRKAVARKYKKWVTSEVLPSIRKTGRYQMSGSGAGEGMIPLAVHQNLKIEFA